MPFEELSTESCEYDGDIYEGYEPEELKEKEAYEDEGMYDVYGDEFDLGSSTDYSEDIRQLYTMGEMKG